MKGLYRITLIAIALFVALGTEAQVKRVNVRTQTPCPAKSDVIYECDYVDEQPQFPGGEREMINFINSTRKYPYEAYQQKIQGRVVCSFVVNPDGTISHLCVIKGCHELLNEEAMRIIKAMPHMVTDPGGVLIKIGQGAKPGDGGLLPEAKVAEHVQAIRGVPKATLASPPNHQGLYSIEESVQKMHLSMNAAFGFRVPVAIKCAASATSVSVYNNLLRDPYKICGGFFIDGIQGGTGAANEISLDHTGHPVVSKIRDCYLAAVKQGRQGQIPLYGGGGIGMTGDAAADAFKMMCLGANGVFVGKVLIQLLGCVGNEQGR